MSLTEAQQAIRATGIGGSEVSAVLGESPFSSPFDVYLAKAEGWRQPETEDMRRGTFLEAGLGAWYSHRVGAALRPGMTTRHKSSAVALATPDFLTEPDVEGQLPRLVSIKCPRRGGDAWGPDGVGPFPDGYALQLQWEHLVMSSHGPIDDEMHLAALVDGDLRIYPVQADRELQAWLLGYVEGWWSRHVVARVPPPMDGSSQAGAWLAKRHPKDTAPVRPATPWEDGRMLALADAEREASRWTGEVETLRNELKQAMGEAGGLESPAGVVTWKADRNGKRSFRTRWNP